MPSAYCPHSDKGEASVVLVTASGDNPLITKFDFDRLTDLDSDIVTQSSRSLVIEVDNLRYAFTGSNVRYNNADEPTAGTITAIDISRNANLVFHVDGLNVSAPEFYRATFYPQDPLSLIFAGNDEFRGGAQNDYLYDQRGHNVLIGGAGKDYLAGGDGNDHLYGGTPSGGPDDGDTLNGGGGSDYLQGNAGNDTINGGEGSDRINGGADDDQLLGQSGNDTINGNRGNDSILGQGDNDVLRGGQGNDTLNGEAGSDILMGDRGIDQLRGGVDNDADIFVFGPDTSPIGATAADLDTIYDFGAGADLFSLGFKPTALLIEVSDAVAIQVFGDARALAEAAFAAHAGDGEVALVTRSPYEVYLFWDSSGDGTIDSAVYLFGYNTHEFTLNDFI